jgi:sugar-specific transcriptional regulator TrmB
MTETKQILQDYGLSEKEARVYIMLLSLGTSSVNNLSKKTNLIRTTTYDVLKSLKDKGIVSFITQNKVQYFQATPPEKLIQILDEKKEKITSILPDLKNLHVEVSKFPAVELFEGKEGIKSIYQDIITERKPLNAVSNTHYIFNVLPFFVPNFVKSRAKNKIHIRLLNEKTKESLELMKNKDKEELRETRFIPELKDVAITEYIYGEKVAILNTNPEDPFGILIRNKDYAKTQEILFNLLWNKSER